MGYVRSIHNVPYTANVDIYANEKLIIYNLAYGDYTPYIDDAPMK
ncbi:MAG: DUF4397 domain-containing protein [Velocimicrobium sp.]